MNPTSGDASIFLPLEQTALAQTAEPRRRTALFARYSVIGSLAGALGVLAASIPDLPADGASAALAVMQLMFVGYAVLGLDLAGALPAAVAGDRGGSGMPHAPLGQSKRLVYGLAALFGMDSLRHRFSGAVAAGAVALPAFPDLGDRRPRRSCSGAASARQSPTWSRCRSPRASGSSTRWCSRICRRTFC